MKKKQYVPVMFDLIDNKEFMKLSGAQLKILFIFRRYIYRSLEHSRNGLNDYYLKGELATCLSLSKIATKTNMSERWARISIRGLERKEIIITTPQDGRSSIYILGMHNKKKGVDYKETYFYEDIFSTAGRKNNSGDGRNIISPLRRNNPSAKNKENNNIETLNKEIILSPKTATPFGAGKSGGFPSGVIKREKTGEEGKFRPFITVYCKERDPLKRIETFIKNKDKGTVFLYNKAASKPNLLTISQLFKIWERHAIRYNQRDGAQKVKLVSINNSITENNIIIILRLLGYPCAKRFMKWVFENKFSAKKNINNTGKNPNLGFISKGLMMEYGEKYLGWIQSGYINTLFYQNDDLRNAWDNKIGDLFYNNTEGGK